jgi:hypothetical protein
MEIAIVLLEGNKNIMAFFKLLQVRRMNFSNFSRKKALAT